MKLSSLTSVATVLAVSLGTSVAQAETNPFMAKPLSSMTLADNHHANHEGKCGEGKCGGAKGAISKEDFMKKHGAMFDKADANKDGMLDAKEHKALHSEMKKGMKSHKEGKCGEGKCGGAK